jgi:hypothetical protein
VETQRKRRREIIDKRQLSCRSKKIIVRSILHPGHKPNRVFFFKTRFLPVQATHPNQKPGFEGEDAKARFYLSTITLI